MAKIPTFDPLAIEFPSDSITVKDLIRLHPARFKWDWPDTGFFHDPGHSFATLTHMMLVERDFAAKAYNEALSEEQNEYLAPESDRFGEKVSKDSLIEELSNAYVRLGLSTGLNQTRELAKKISDQAKAQARLGQEKTR